MTTKPKLIVPKHVWDGAQAEKNKNELEKVPEPTGFRIVLFPLKLKNKTASGIRIDGGELRIINDDEVLAVVDDPRDILPANIL
jgi:hypothetical protein